MSHEQISNECLIKHRKLSWLISPTCVSKRFEGSFVYGKGCVYLIYQSDNHIRCINELYFRAYTIINASGMNNLLKKLIILTLLFVYAYNVSSPNAREHGSSKLANIFYLNIVLTCSISDVQTMSKAHFFNEKKDCESKKAIIANIFYWFYCSFLKLLMRLKKLGQNWTFTKGK